MGRVFAYGVAVVAVLVLSLVLVAVAMGSREGTAEASPGVPGGGDEILGTIEVRAFDIGFEPTTVDVPETGRCPGFTIGV